MRKRNSAKALKPIRPVVLVYPEGSWSELVPESSLQCEDSELRNWESDLRMSIFQMENIKDDLPFEPYFNIPWKVKNGGVLSRYRRSRTLIKIFQN